MSDSNNVNATVSLGRHFAIVSAPILAVVIALIEHRFVPDTLVVLDSDSYRAFLGIVLTLSILLAVTATLWRGFGETWRHYAPLVAGAVAVIVVWDLATQKFALLPPFYFPGPARVLAGVVDDRGILLESIWHSLLLLLTGYA